MTPYEKLLAAEAMIQTVDNRLNSEGVKGTQSVVVRALRLAVEAMHEIEARRG